jgi:hypothetical protein
MSNAQLVGMCKAKGVRGYTGKRKDWLVENCCVGRSGWPHSTEKPSGEARPGYEEEKQKRAEAEERMKRERARAMWDEQNQAFERDVNSIKPANMKNILVPGSYNTKKIERQMAELKAIERGEGLWAPNPIATGVDPIDFCPASITVLKRIVTSGILYNEKGWEVDKVFKHVTIGKIDPINRGAYSSSDGEVKNRHDPDVDLLVMDDSRVRIDAMKRALKTRFRPIGHINGNACFDVEKSTSGNYYGVFLKHLRF